MVDFPLKMGNTQKSESKTMTTRPKKSFKKGELASRAIDPFFKNVGKFLGVPPGEIRLSLSNTPGEFTLFGPFPRARKELIEIPVGQNYCFTFVIKLAPPRGLCNAYRAEYAQLKAQLQALIEAEAWDEVTTVVERINELKRAINDICIFREHVYTYCIFPDEWAPILPGMPTPWEGPWPPPMPLPMRPLKPPKIRRPTRA